METKTTAAAPPQVQSLDYVALTLAAALFIASFLGIQFEEKWLKHFISEQNHTAKSIGYLTALNGNVKRKFFGDVLWAPFEDDANVFNGDKLFTDKNSTTQVYLQNTGLQITLEPESLVQLNEDEMNIENGNFELKLFGNKPTTFRAGNQKITVSSKKGVIKLRQNKLKNALEVSVVEGNIDVITKKGKEAINQGAQLNIDQAGKIETQKLEKQILKTFFPENKHAFNSEEIPKINFLWQNIEGAEEYTIEVANNKKFENPIVSSITKDSNFEVNNLEDGKYFWRAKFKSGNYSEWSKPTEFSILIKKPAIKEEPKKVEPPKPKVAKKAPQKPKLRKPAANEALQKELGKAKTESVEFVEE